ncbi:hypothetical protein M5689_019898 [Euphorbia peplus]|nr:hypothetical protein M5689_019898 [Euphorbia peplus]
MAPKIPPFHHHFPLLSLTFIHFLTSFLIPFCSPTQPSIYDHLKTNGLPVGLLPKGISDFSFEPNSGHFQINLTQPCNAKFENQMHYDFNVSGVLSFGNIGGLNGMSQQELFLWFPVKGIRVDVPSSGLIYFDVGVVDKQFSLSLFENPIECTAADQAVDSRGSDYFENVPGRLAFKAGHEDLRAAS